MVMREAKKWLIHPCQLLTKQVKNCIIIMEKYKGRENYEDFTHI